MPDRLTDLQRQRALIQEHLAWLDREIATVQKATPTPSASATAFKSIPVQATPASHVSPATAPAEISAEEIIAQYKQEHESLHGTVKRGCLIYFFLALGLVALGVVALYLFRTRT